jgi:hypothetical protein
MILMSPTFGYHDVVPAIALVDMRTFWVYTTRAFPYSRLRRNLLTRFEIYFEEVDFRRRARTCGAMDVDFSVVVNKDTRVNAFEVEVDRITPVI